MNQKQRSEMAGTLATLGLIPGASVTRTTSIAPPEAPVVPAMTTAAFLCQPGVGQSLGTSGRVPAPPPPRRESTTLGDAVAGPTTPSSGAAAAAAAAAAGGGASGGMAGAAGLGGKKLTALVDSVHMDDMKKMGGVMMGKFKSGMEKMKAKLEEK